MSHPAERISCVMYGSISSQGNAVSLLAKAGNRRWEFQYREVGALGVRGWRLVLKSDDETEER